MRRRMGLLRIWLITIVVGVAIPAAIVAGLLFREGLVAVAVVVLGLAVYFIALTLYTRREVVRRIEALSDAAESIGMGDFSYRIELHTGDVFEELADSLNVMAERLDTSRKSLEQERARAISAAREARTLYKVSQSLISTLDLGVRMRLIAETLADVCQTNKVAVWLVEGNHLVPTTSFGTSPDEEEMFRRWKVHVEEAIGMTREVITSKHPVVIDDAVPDPRFPAELAERLNIRSVLALPFIFEDEPIGYALTYEAGKLRKFTNYQKTLAQAVGAQAAVAIENVRAYERERRISEVLQRAFLPTVPPSVDNFEIADRYAAASREVEIGGDFYDLFNISPDRIAIVIGDVSGKGLSAGVHTAMVKYMLRAYAVDDPDPVDLVSRLNAAVYKYIGGEMFVTLFYGVLDVPKRELAYVTAGHEQPLLFGEDRRICMRLETTGTGLGIVPTYDFTMRRMEFVPGDVLLMYTDGAVDARRDGRFLGVEGLEQMFCNAASKDAHEIVDEVDRGIRDYSQGLLPDDVALMVLKYRRRPSPMERITGERE